MPKKDIKFTIDELRQFIDDPKTGLPEELFRFVTELTPMVNVDLLVQDMAGRYLLAWRSDEFCEGWHIPGGIVRVKESFAHRIEQVSLTELCCMVKYDPRPIHVQEFIEHAQTIRSHFVSFLFKCRTPESYSVESQPRKLGEAGFLAWHDSFPENMINVHWAYKRFFK